ncbi:chorismate mutase [Natrarchaeobius sp. A-rgal3]|uniref:chorismate mutase n=1 Tax=Natrarchaeobius versutus TaxID=1679078 RepID=UPI00350F6E80
MSGENSKERWGVLRRALLVTGAVSIAGCMDVGASETERTDADSELAPVDEEILELIDERMAIADEIGRIKAREGLPVEVPEQESVVLDRVADDATSEGVDPDLVRAVYRDLLEMSKDVQRRHVEDENSGEETVTE